MDYRKIYNRIIERAKKRTLTGYKEKHHIIPKCLGGSNKKENLVALTSREHFVAHQLLVKIYPETKALVMTLMLMTGANKFHNRDNVIPSWAYSKFCKSMRELRLGYTFPEETKRKISATMRGVKKSEAHKAAMRKRKYDVAA